MRNRSEDQDTLGARIAAPLKVPERADPTFAARVMTTVRTQGRATAGEAIVHRDQAPWWRRSVVVRVSPLGGLALAAGLATLMFATAALLTDRDRSAGTAHSVAARGDTVHLVRFVFVAQGASSVALVGDFNQWDVTAHRLVRAGADGVWSASVPLTSGRHEYAFVIDGTRWVADPAAAASIADEFGGASSVVTVGDKPRPRSS